MKISINKDLYQAYIDDEPLKLTLKEYNLLSYLFDNKNKIFTRKELCNTLNYPSFDALNLSISRLKKKLGLYKHYIHTRNGVGYGFVCE